MCSAKARPAEKAFVVPCVGGFRLRPENPSAMTLLMRLFGDDASAMGDLIQMSLPELRSNLIDVATQKWVNMSIQFCGDLKNAPTILLRDKRLPDVLSGAENGEPTSAWDIRIQSVYGNTTSCHYQIGAVRPTGTETWWPMSQAPLDLLNQLAVTEDYGFEYQSTEGLWEAFTGKKTTFSLHSIAVIVTQVENDNMDCSRRYAIGQIELPEAVAATRHLPRKLKASVDLKWGCFYSHPEEWADHGYQHVIEALGALVVGQQMEISSAPWKEIRFAKATVMRLGQKTWKVSGYVTCSWDEPYELAQTLGVYLTDNFEWSSNEECDDAIKRCLEEAGDDAAGCHTISDEDAFRECIPFSEHTWEPGVDCDFNFTVRGDVKKVLAKLSIEEDKALAYEKKCWNEVEEMFARSKPGNED